MLLPKVNLEKLHRKVPQAKTIRQHKDGSISVYVPRNTRHEQVVEELISYFNKKTSNYLETPNYYYRNDPSIRQILIQWSLSFEGCLALLLLSDPKTARLIDPEWQCINSYVGGLFLSPYTLFFYADRVKIIHPITLQNFEARKTIEQVSASYVRSLLRVFKRAKRELKGVAMAKYVSRRTRLTNKEITTIVNEKSSGVKTPIYSGFFAE